MQDKILEIFLQHKFKSNPLVDIITMEELKELASEISSQFTVIAEGEVEINGYDIRISNGKEIFYLDDTNFWETLEGKKIQLILREVK